MKAKLSVVLFLLIVCFRTAAGDSPTVKTLALKEGAVSSPAGIEDVSWLSGYWKGEGLGGVSEEFWTEPSGKSMAGLYRLVKDGKIVFQEFLLITEQNNSLILKLKHFNPDLTGWEEKDQTVDFPLVRVGTNEAFFDGLTYRKLQDGSLQIFLKLRKAGGETVEEEFRFHPQN